MFVSYSYLIASIILATVHSDQSTSPIRYDNWSSIKIWPNTEIQLENLKSLIKDQQNLVLAREGSLNKPFGIYVSPNRKVSFLNELNNFNIRYAVTCYDLQTVIDMEKRPVSHLVKRSTRPSGRKYGQWFNRYLTPKEIDVMVRRMARRHRDIVTIGKIGVSHEKRPIRLIKVSSGGNTSKPAIWIDAGIHAREWISQSTALYILNQLVYGYKTNRTLVDGADWYFVPVLNPDGYAYSHNADRMWRKNRRPVECVFEKWNKTVCGDPQPGECVVVRRNETRCTCVGADLNRNFDYDFGGIGSSADSCDLTYPGPSAFSEPESQAVRDFLLSGRKIRAYITLHSYSQMWFYPYGAQFNSTSEDWQELAALAEQGAQALKAVYGTEYQVGTAANLLYPSGGGSDDWAKGVAGIKYVYTLELTPDDDGSDTGFILPPARIIPTGKETWAGLRVVFDAVINSYQH